MSVLGAEKPKNTVKTLQCKVYGNVKMKKNEFLNFVKTPYLSCRECSEGSKTLYRIKIGALLRK